MKRFTTLAAGAAAATLAALGVAVATPAHAAVGCRVDYQVTSAWPGGFGAAVAITNLGDPITSWRLMFNFPSGQTISQLWNGTATQDGPTVTVRNAAWNGSIATGGTASFGFNGTGSDQRPAVFLLNGTRCTGVVTTTPGTPFPTTPVATPPSATPVKIMALGDSITGSPGCWRALLWQMLPASRVDFVGTLPPQGCGFPYDGENEGHGGYLATTVANQNLLVGWLAATHPDVVMMHFGTNDVWNNLSPDAILAAFTTLVTQMRASNPHMKILVAQILPMHPSNCAECGQRVVDLNAAIPAWAGSQTTAASPITVVDQWTGFNDDTDTNDGVHPNDSGNVKIANRWFPAVSAAIS